MKTRKRVCENKSGAKETCYGNWFDRDEDGQDKFGSLKYQKAPCNEVSCPGKGARDMRIVLLLCNLHKQR